MKCLEQERQSAVSHESLDLAGEHRLLLRRGAGRDVLDLVASDGRIQISIEITRDGPVLRLEGAAVAIRASSELSLEADRLTLHGRDSVSVSSGGRVEVRTPGDIRTEARTQEVRATHGNVNLKANDDIRLDGERVLVNC